MENSGKLLFPGASSRRGGAASQLYQPPGGLRLPAHGGIKINAREAEALEPAGAVLWHRARPWPESSTTSGGGASADLRPQDQSHLRHLAPVPRERPHFVAALDIAIWGCSQHPVFPVFFEELSAITLNPFLWPTEGLAYQF